MNPADYSLWYPVPGLGGPRLPSYRLYRLDGAGKIVSADWVEAKDDDEAVREARNVVGESHFELWDRKRLVSGPERAP